MESQPWSHPTEDLWSLNSAGGERAEPLHPYISSVWTDDCFSGQTSSACKQNCSRSPSTVFPRELWVQALRSPERGRATAVCCRWGWQVSQLVGRKSYRNCSYGTTSLGEVAFQLHKDGAQAWWQFLDSHFNSRSGSSLWAPLAHLGGRSKLAWILENQSPAHYREWLTSFSTHRDEANVTTLVLATQADPIKWSGWLIQPKWFSHVAVSRYIF